MCYGNLDPKFMMRDIEARMKGVVAFGEPFGKQGKPVAAGRPVPLFSSLRVMLRSWLRQDAVLAQTVGDVFRGR